MFNNTAKDEIWRIHRHCHIAEMPSLLAGWNKAFRESENYKLLKNSRTLTRPRDQMKLLRTKDHTSELVEMYARHRHVAGKLLEHATADPDAQTQFPLMFQVSEVEGQITTGLDGDSGKALGDDKVRQNLCDLLAKYEVEIDTKVRLIALWFIHYGVRYSQEAHRAVWAACQPALPAKRIAQIGQLLYMKVPMNNHGRTGAEKKEWKQRRAETLQRAVAIQKTNTRSTRVHTPNLARVVGAHIDTTLTTDEYRWRDVNRAPDPNGDLDPEEAPHWYLPGVFSDGLVAGGGTDAAAMGLVEKKGGKKGFKRRGSTDGTKGGGARSLRKHKIGAGSTGLRFGAKGAAVRSSGSLDAGGGGGGVGSGRGGADGKAGGGGAGGAGGAGAGGEPSVRDPGFKFEGPRIIVVVFGGITYAEMRSMYEIMAKTKREIIVCCTDIVTPNMFMQSLGSMSAPDMSSDEESSSSGSESEGSVGLDDVELQ